MISQFRVENYKALRDVALSLTPMHVLIGPNDSGKTSILEALTACCRSVDHPLNQCFPGNWDGAQLVWNRSPRSPVTLAATVTSDRDFTYELAVVFRDQPGKHPFVQRESLRFIDDGPELPIGRLEHTETTIFQRQRGEARSSAEEINNAKAVAVALRGVHYYHWDPQMLALPVASDSGRRFRMEPGGFGLAQCLDDILGDNRDRFIALESKFRRIFPGISSIKLVPVPAYKWRNAATNVVPMLDPAEGKGIYFSFEGGNDPVAAAQASDGVLLILAYLTILHLPTPPRLLLIEEPENGIHPARLKDVLSILRELVEEQSHTQVVMTTHSPYVVDLFSAEEVTLCQRTRNGDVTVTRLSESQKVREQLDVFTLGEIWTAEGDAALADAVPAQPKVAP
jgi:predicted ATPase